MKEYNPIIEYFRAAIFDTIAQPLMVLDEGLHILSANKRFYDDFRVTPGETREQNIFEIGDGQWNVPELKRLLLQILPDKTVVEDFEVSHDFQRIGHRVFHVNAREIKGQHFQTMNVILIALTDITERKQWADTLVNLNKELRAANSELEKFGAMISHDLRAPIRSIRHFSEAVLSEYRAELGSDSEELLQRVVHNAEVMDSMITSLSQLTGLSRARIQRVPTNLSEIAEKVSALLQDAEPDRPVRVDIRKNLTDEVDPSMVTLALSNLLSNAWKFTRDRKPAEISFDVRDENGRRIYMVRDNGIGFEQKYAEKAFEMFQRLHPDGENRYEGMGAGLAIVRSVVERHGGKVWAESEVNRGTTVFFTLCKEPN